MLGLINSFKQNSLNMNRNEFSKIVAQKKRRRRREKREGHYEKKKKSSEYIKHTHTTELFFIRLY